MTAGCVFCDIVAGGSAGSVIYDDEHAVALLDIFPVHPGHALVVPRRHCADIRDCPADLARHLFGVSARLAPAIASVVGAEAFNIWTAAGRAAGQTVFHLHLHVLPRFDDDGFGPRLPKTPLREAPRAELEEMAGRIRAALDDVSPRG